MEGRVKSHISNKTYTTDLEILEEEDVDQTSELYLIPISGHKIMVAPGKSIMENGIAYCYVYVIKDDKVLCKLGIYEKKTETMPLFFDISTFPEGSFCLFEEYEKNPSKLLDFEIVESMVKTKMTKNVFDVLIEGFEKIPNKRERIKSAYKSLFSIYETKKGMEKYKKMKIILKLISDAGKISETDKEAPPTDVFIRTLKTNAADDTSGSLFVMSLLALQFVFLIEFSFLTDNEELKSMKLDWSIKNATHLIEVDVESQGIVVTPEVQDSENEDEDADEKEADVQEEEAEAEAESQIEVEKELDAEAEQEAKFEDKSEVEAEDEPTETVESFPNLSKSKTKPKSRPSTIPENKSLSMNKAETVKSKKSTPKNLETTESLSKKKSESVPKESKAASVPKESKAVYVPDEPMPSVGTYVSPLSKANIQSIVARTKSHKSTAKLIQDFQAGIEPSTPEDEKRLRSALVEMASAKLMKASKRGSDPASVLASAVSKLKANKPEPASEPSVTLKKNRSIPAVKIKSKTDKSS